MHYSFKDDNCGPRTSDDTRPIVVLSLLNDPVTKPSKRSGTLLPVNQNRLMGTLAALQIDLETIRTACPHFRNCLERLERLPLQHET